MNHRIIARLDIKKNDLIKGVQMEGWRKVGSPSIFAEKFYLSGADELLYMDVVASLYQRNNLKNIVSEVAEKVFIPITVGGGIDNLKSADELMKSGADKLAINTAATKRPALIKELSEYYGSQAVVVSIEAKKQQNSWTAMTDNGRNHTGLDVISWAAKCQSLGAGEILITSIDQDGTKKGPDIELIENIVKEIDIPVIYSGGFENENHIKTALDLDLDAVALASAIHYELIDLGKLKTSLFNQNYKIRPSQ